VSGKVFDELTCPDCGGYLPGAADVPPGMRSCTCFKPSPPSKRRLPDEPDPIDMTPLPDHAAPRVDGKKLCRVCGKDLTGRSRLKDDKGYICKKCSDAEFAADDERERDLIPCPECHRKLKAAAFTEYRGTLICRRCHVDHMENDKLKVAKLGELSAHKEADKRFVLTLSIVAGVVALLGAISWLIMHR
jgi:hypothetical protein